MNCSQKTHEALKADVHTFERGTRDPQAWAGLLTAECLVCDSTIAHLCALCGKPCAATDALPFGAVEDDRRVHTACVAQGMIDSGIPKLLVMAGSDRAGDIVKRGGVR